MKVLLVSGKREAAPSWARSGRARFELSHARSLDAAAERLGAEQVDAVVIGADVVAAASDGQAVPGLTQLRASAHGSPLLLLTDGDRVPGPDETALMDALLPADAAPDVQARLLELTAERAALAATVQERTLELERRTRELDGTRAQFRSVIERNADAIVVVDREGVIRFANAAAAALFGSARDDLLGTEFGFPMVAGETTELDLLHGGQSRVVEMRVVDTEWEGAPACIASLRDITERKRAEEGARRLIREQTARTAAEQAARRFRFLAESSTVLASSLDYRTTLSALLRLCIEEVADWAVIYVTEEDGGVRRLEVAHRDPALSETVRDLRELPIDPAGRHPVLEVVRTRTPMLVRTVDEAQLHAITQDEEHLELTRRLGMNSFMLVPLIARDRCVGAIALVSTDPARPYDREDLAQAQDLALRAALAVDNARLYHDAQHANQSKTDLLAVISHDLRTPLNAIMGHAELLELGIPDTLSDAGRERVGRIRMSARHLLYLIDELLSFARLEAGREEVRLQDIDVCQLAQEVAAVVEPLALQRKLRFMLDLAPSPIVLRTDPDKLRQVLLNLAANAVKYTREGAVRFEVNENAAAGVVLRMHDTGVGIRTEHLQRIFEPFWQADATQRNSENGTGLGLSVVQRIVRLLGGEVSVESEPGVGSTFTVILPRQPAGPACEPKPGADAAHAAARTADAARAESPMES